MPFTEMYRMKGHTREYGSLPSIGSFAQNAADEEADADFVNLLQEAKKAENRLANVWRRLISELHRDPSLRSCKLGQLLSEYHPPLF
ncbi:hypothetical protein ACJ73_06664 [Blastomyces percursus]|uniref:Uncharacterized protein n=1 Tax=Blastomyces percursus TaxID=1658174 RepID=A0A1J9R300_9EURO|nr:hypothetical protein ACJ73_06664 [Blastomyces percursus]